MVSAAAEGGEDGNGGGNRDSSHHKGKNTFETPPDPKKMSTFKRGMLRHLQGITADVISRGEEPPWNGIYAPKEMHHYLQRKTADAIARGEDSPYGGLYATPPDPSVANPPTTKPSKEAKPSPSRRRNG
jgi:hypothetical protein